tara:strand:- start:8770 stop:8946 length:177 start_codon:yes stop_codon:yes gene_type:complete
MPVSISKRVSVCFEPETPQKGIVSNFITTRIAELPGKMALNFSATSELKTPGAPKVRL